MRQVLTIEIASVPDRDDVVAEIWLDKRQLAEIRREGGSLIVQIYPPAEDSYWEVSFEQLLEVLKRAQERLLGVR